MKLSVGKRILMFFHWLLSLLVVVGLALYVIVPDFFFNVFDQVRAFLKVDMRVAGIVLLVVYAILVIVQLWIIFKRKKRDDRGFITVDASDTGRTRIAISAIEAMVRQSVTHIDGITDMKITIENNDDAISIRVIATILNGGHVPTITMNMQRAIRQFVEMNCGVAVRQVHISINAVTNEKESGSRRSKRDKKGAEPTGNVSMFREAAPEPVKEVTPKPIREVTPEPVKEVTPEPVREVTPEPVREYTPAPVPEPVVQPVVNETVQPEPVTPSFEPARGTVTPEFSLDHKPTLTLDPFGTRGNAVVEEEPVEEIVEAPETEEETDY